MVKNKKQPDEWVEKRSKIVQNLNTSLKEADDILLDAKKTQDVGHFVFNFMTEKKKKLEQEIELFKMGEVEKIRPGWSGSLDYYYDLSKQDAEYMGHIRSSIGAVRTDYDSIIDSVQTSGVAITTSLGTNASSVARGFTNIDEALIIVDTINQPSPNDRRRELQNKLKALNPDYSKLVEASWKTYHDRSNPERFSQSALSMRNLIQRLLGHLGPDNKVTSVKGYESGRANGKGPSWTQRALYAMIGENNTIDPKEIEYIKKITQNTKKQLDRLSDLVKKRDDVNDLDDLTETVLDDCQIFLLNILNARTRYFSLSLK